ncbi:MAG: HAD-IIB family hydrolase [Planctomycetaceae bacterium]|nr:HAD-IIB family hydrolase [Planctomycetaceae bacterium]
MMCNSASGSAAGFLLFTDVDGCLVNKNDYGFAPAVPVLRRLRTEGIPVVLASSKTGCELQHLAEQFELEPAPLICENGGEILWRESDGGNTRTVAGAERSKILRALNGLKPTFQFRSFADLELHGVMAATNLSEAEAIRALDRHSTEPLIWDDAPDRIPVFAEYLQEFGLTLTRGGRFWHVAGNASKGSAMDIVIQHYRSRLTTPVTTIAVGDSPIDQDMLDRADIPIAIPDPEGRFHVQVSSNGHRAGEAGSLGWAETMTRILDDVTGCD